MDGEIWEELLELLVAAGKLKRLKRRGWVEAGIEEPESVAEHSFRTALLAMMLADLRGLDAERAMRMALIHDLAEAMVGDLTPEEKRRRGPAYLMEEGEAMERLLSHLPKPLSDSYLSMWNELRCAGSPEAEIVIQSDRLEMCIQAMEYLEAGHDPSRLERFLQIEAGGLSKELHHEIIKRIKSKK